MSFQSRVPRSAQLLRRRSTTARPPPVGSAAPAKSATSSASARAGHESSNGILAQLVVRGLDLGDEL